MTVQWQILIVMLRIFIDIRHTPLQMMPVSLEITWITLHIQCKWLYTLQSVISLALIWYSRLFCITRLMVSLRKDSNIYYLGDLWNYHPLSMDLANQSQFQTIPSKTYSEGDVRLSHKELTHWSIQPSCKLTEKSGSVCSSKFWYWRRHDDIFQQRLIILGLWQCGYRSHLSRQVFVFWWSYPFDLYHQHSKWNWLTNSYGKRQLTSEGQWRK
jgi:hypothetical protein